MTEEQIEAEAPTSVGGTLLWWSVRDKASGHVLRSGFTQNADDVDRQAVDESEYAQIEDGPVEVYRAPTEVTAAMVKAHAARLLRYSDWYVTRRMETDEPIPEGVSAYRQAVRDASGAIEAMDPIPADYQDQRHWPVSP